MAAKKKVTKRVKFVGLQKLLAAVSMLSFFVTIIGGLRAEAHFTTIVIRATGVMVVIFFVSKTLVKILASYEEMHDSGKA